tara:strand:- start:3724 stop:5709 length:1986 start_codon:yes stop_codon:yes gene_type:complete
MASSVIGALRVNLGLDSANFESGAKRVQAPLAAMRKQFVAVAAVAAAAGGAITAMALKGANDIDVAAKAARRLGTSVGGYRALEMAAGEAGVSLSALANDVQTMDREIARGSKNASAALDRLGLSAKDLEGLEADQKVALIADGIKDLGLTSGQASALLQDLGVRNREMVLAVLSGGDVFRQARTDVQQYGLAISSTDSEAIEQANDRIGRLGLIGQYAGQQLAISIVPTLGAMAQAMTDSLREGGLLRTMIDGLAKNIQRVGTYVTVLVTGLGVRYVAAAGLARLATLSFAGSLAFLRSALIRTGIGALIVGAGELVYQFSKLVVASGGFGNALDVLKDIGVEVFDRLRRGGALLGEALSFVALGVEGEFQRSFAGIAMSFADLTKDIAAGINALLGTNLSGFGDGFAENLASSADNKIAVARDGISSIGQSIIGLAGPLKSLDRLKEIKLDELQDGSEAADRFADALDNVASSAGGAGSAVDGAKAKVKGLKDTANDMRDTFKDAFKGIITGAQNLGEVVRNILNKITDKLLDSAFDTLWGGASSGGGILGGIGGLAKSIFGGFRANGGSVSAGKGYIVGERGPEWFQPGSSGTIVPNGAMGGAQGLNVTVTMDRSTGSFGAFVRDAAGKLIAEAAPGIKQSTLAATPAYLANNSRRLD